MLVLHDLRLAFRQLRKAPGFTLTVLLTLSVGIAATTAIFSLVEGILLRPLPFQDPDRLVLLGDHIGASEPLHGVTAREIGTYSSATSAFSSMGGSFAATYELSGGAVPEVVRAARLTAGVFPTLGTTPIMGRVFTQQEEDAHQQLAVISYALWMNRYHRDPHVLGSSIVLDRNPYEIIGVMPRDFEFPLQTGQLDQAQLWVPMSLTADELSEQSAGMWGYQLVARLKDGVSLTQAVQDADRVAQQIIRDFPGRMSAIKIRGDVKPLREYAVADARPMLRILLFAVSIVLLIACVNVAGLLLVRAIRGHREYAVRLALGARSSTIIRASVVEGLLLSSVGGLLGLALAAILVRIAVHVLPESMPRINNIAIDATVAAFAIVVALATGAVCSLVPAFASLRTNLVESLKGLRTTASSRSWLRSALLVSEIAVALVLLTVCGAFLRSLEKMRAVDPGFRPDHALVARYRLPLNQYPTDSSVTTFNRAVVERIARQPGVMAVGLTTGIPASGRLAGADFFLEGQATDKWKGTFAYFAMVSGDYFHAMGIPLISGRYFTENDTATSPLVVIVNQTMARHCWPIQEAVGKRFHVGNPKSELPWVTVVGVVADVKLGSRDAPSEDEWYTPAEQPASMGISYPSGKLTAAAGGYIAVRSALPPEQMSQTLQGSVAEIDPLLALRDVWPMTDALSNVEAPRRFNTDLITAFAVGALLLAVIGIYAVVAFSVSLRTQEIAIRMALGAQRAGIARLVLISGARLALAGCVLGVLGSVAAARIVGSLLFEVSATDPLIYAAAVVIMIAMTLLASAVPATRAASQDPIVALRSI